MPVPPPYDKYVDHAVQSIFVVANTNSSALGYITYSSNFDSDPTGDMII